MRVGVVQMTSVGDVARNLAAAAELLAEAADRGAQLVALPENFAYLRREGLPVPCAQGLDGQIAGFLCERARQHGVWLLGGTLPERISGDTHIHNTSVLVDPQGEISAVYRKIHLFDVDLRASGGDAFVESSTVAPGKDVVVAETPFGGLGLSVCYDVRFPELYRAMAAQGARFLAVPAAFARETGKDHWEVLLRARAVENQAFVIAPAQCGRHNPERASYGRSLVADPWGLVIARAGDRPCVLVADCDLEEQDRIRRDLPALAHRRL
jgi:predicted amidohydrolase